jgi:hypothetical protein
MLNSPLFLDIVSNQSSECNASLMVNIQGELWKLNFICFLSKVTQQNNFHRSKLSFYICKIEQKNHKSKIKLKLN